MKRESATPEPPSEDAVSEIQVLIVDDNEMTTRALCTYMEKHGFRAIPALRAETALEVLAENRIDVVITDIMMPGMDGLELTDRIRRTYDADVIVMTGYGGQYSYEEAVTKGASDFIFKPVRFEELLLRLRRVVRERRLTRERNRMVVELERLAITDGLTKLYNSRHFYHQLELEVNRSRRYKNPLSLLLIDIDLFKEYNDTYGHLKGDEVLVRMGQVVRSLLRKMDSAYRYGGEEFTIILPETSGEEAKVVAHRIRRAVEAESFHPAPERTASITVSIGVTQYLPSEDPAAFVARADRAMYDSKAQGRNRVSALLPEPTDA